MSPQERNEMAINNRCQLKKKSFSSHQWQLLIGICFVNICTSMCYSLQGPFYPNEAKKKGVDASIYGMVFGIYELVNVLLCPIYGIYIRQIGPKIMLNAGTYLGAVSSILFGFVNKTSKTAFITLSFTLRIFEAIGQAAYITANFAIISTEFPDDLAFAFTAVETSYYIGLIIGPCIGGLLYELGGFSLPFVVNGVVLFIAATINLFAIPQIATACSRPIRILELLQIPSIATCYYAIFEIAFGVGFITVLLGPFLASEFGVSTMKAGFIFVIPAASFAAIAFFWATLANNHVHPMLISGLGGVLLLIGSSFVGPAPFFNIEKSIWLVIISLVVYGFGSSAVNVSAFVNCNEEAVRHGFPANMETHGLISGLWMSGISLGNFIGPIIAGFIGDTIGFKNGTVILSGFHISLIILSLVSYRYQMSMLTDLKYPVYSDCLLEKSEIVSDEEI